MKTTYKETKRFTAERLIEAIEKALAFAKENNFILKDKAHEDVYYELYKSKIKIKISGISFTMRKKINKKMSFLEYSMTRKKINLFFHYLNTRLKLNAPIKFEMSSAETEVVSSREKYKLLKTQLEEARVNYKSLKASYYGKGEINTEYVEN